eukprot:TRINITY_DN96760_c0_g1_i1.p1 TRINITY_DN96760_c0_g1~~TRINITY_DN96760_c0_g1_i1.p1  ORF type:complete len:325 (-),score=94.93 TRINITY_DN96760_c0_g1_i1:66-1040(-)
MGLEDMQVFKACGLCCCCFWFIFAVIAIPFSFKSMEQGKFAVELLWASQTIKDEPVTQAGLKFVGLGNTLLEYPSTFQTMYFTSSTSGVQATEEGSQFQPIVRGPIRARSKDGLEMYVTVTFQWKLQPQALHELYDILGEVMYRDEFVRFARRAIIKTCSRYTADEYFVNRSSINAEMLQDLADNFNATAKGLSAEIKGLQLQEVDLPDEFDAEIANTQTQMQELEVARAERFEKQVAMETEVEVAESEVKRVKEAARGDAESVLLLNQAEVDQLLIFQERQAMANAEILQQFENDSDPFQRLFELMEVRTLEDHAGDHIMFSM